MSDLNVYTTSQINALTPITGDLVVDSDLNAVKLYNGSAWKTFTTDATSIPYPNRWGAYLNTSWSSATTVSSYDQIDTGYMPTASATDFSMSWWFKGTTTNVNRSLSPTRGNKNVGPYSPYLLSAETANRSLNVAYPGGGTGWSWGGTNTIDDIVDGNWHHLVLVVADNPNGSGSLVELYLDGSLYNSSVEGQFTGHASTSNTSYNFKIGTLSGGAYWFGDYIDDVAFFESKITSSQVTTLYNSGKPGNISSLSPNCWLRMGDDSNDSPTDGGALTSVTDSSGNGNTVTTTATTQPTFKALDQANTSLSFDGASDYLTPGTISALNSASAFTISVWVKLNSGGGAPQRFIETTGGIYGGISFYQSTTGVDLLMGSGNSGYPFVRCLNSNLKDNSWHHVVGVYDGSTTSATVYIDGVASSNTSGGGALPSTTNSAAGGSPHIGSGNTGSSAFVDGFMDDMAIFNAALSAADVTAIYNNGVPNDLDLPASYDTDRTSNLVHWWRMGEDDNLTAGASASQITDASGNGNHATQSTAANQPTASVDTTIYV